jgi:hypothetical protein
VVLSGLDEKQELIKDRYVAAAGDSWVEARRWHTDRWKARTPFEVRLTDWEAVAPAGSRLLSNLD